MQSLDSLAAVAPYRRRQELCRQGQNATMFYRVLAGTALRYVIKPDGRRQVMDLLLPGDFVGLATGEQYDYTVEVVASDTVIAGYPRKRVEMQADCEPQLARELRQIAFQEISRLQRQLLILGCVTAQEKVGSFLLSMADRLSGSGDRVTLPVSRYDIADYLAVSVETVSRALSELRQRGLIRFIGTRVIQIVDRAALESGEHGAGPSRARVAA